MNVHSVLLLLNKKINYNCDFWVIGQKELVTSPNNSEI